MHDDRFSSLYPTLMPLEHVDPLNLACISSVIRPLRSANPAPDPPEPKQFSALYVGVGIGRATADVLLHFVSDIVLELVRRL